MKDIFYDIKYAGHFYILSAGEDFKIYRKRGNLTFKKNINNYYKSYNNIKLFFNANNTIDLKDNECVIKAKKYNKSRPLYLINNFYGPAFTEISPFKKRSNFYYIQGIKTTDIKNLMIVMCINKYVNEVIE